MEFNTHDFDRQVLVTGAALEQVLTAIVNEIIVQTGASSPASRVLMSHHRIAVIAANINPEKVHPSMFEPVHGSAPDIAGQAIAEAIRLG